jgi:hypothetical protein
MSIEHVNATAVSESAPKAQDRSADTVRLVQRYKGLIIALLATLAGGCSYDDIRLSQHEPPRSMGFDLIPSTGNRNLDRRGSLVDIGLIERAMQALVDEGSLDIQQLIGVMSNADGLGIRFNGFDLDVFEEAPGNRFWLNSTNPRTNFFIEADGNPNTPLVVGSMNPEDARARMQEDRQFMLDRLLAAAAAQPGTCIDSYGFVPPQQSVQQPVDVVIPADLRQGHAPAPAPRTPYLPRSAR